MRHSDGHVLLSTPFAVVRRGQVLGTRQVMLTVTSRDKISIQLESLILAQNERWRQA